MMRLIMCNGECNRPYDDYCGMYLEGEECPACKAEKLKRELEALKK